MGQAVNNNDMRAAAQEHGRLWRLHRPKYVAAIAEYRRFGMFDDANGLSEAMHQYDNGNFIISADYRGLP